MHTAQVISGCINIKLVETQDVGIMADCQRLVKESIEGLGGLDIIISNAVSLPKRSIWDPGIIEVDAGIRDGPSSPTLETLMH